MTRAMTSQFHSLLAFIKNKFAALKAESQVVQDARDEVNEEYAAVRTHYYSIIIIIIYYYILYYYYIQHL